MTKYYSYPDLCDSAYCPRVGIIDDDSTAAALMRARIQLRFPACRVSIFTKPIAPPPDLDIYFVDNNFDGQLMALGLLKEIRSVNPVAPVIIVSEGLDPASMRELGRSGCDAFYDKNEPRKSEAAFDVVEHYIKRHHMVQPAIPEKAIRQDKSFFRHLLHQWTGKSRHVGYY